MHTLLKRTLLALFTLLCLAVPAAARQSDYRVLSPNRRIELRVGTSGRVSYDVLVGGRALSRSTGESVALLNGVSEADVRLEA